MQPVCNRGEGQLALTSLNCWCRRGESNPRPRDYETLALPLSYAGTRFAGRFDATGTLPRVSTVHPARRNPWVSALLEKTTERCAAASENPRLRWRYFFLAASAYFRWKRSTRPAVSISFCLPVKNGWQLEQISTRIKSPLCVDRV